MFSKIKKTFSNIKKGFNSYKNNLAKNPKKRLTFIIGLLVIIILILIFTNLGFFVSVIVNGQPITRWQLIKELEKQGGKQVLDSIVTQKLIYQEAKKNNINVTQQDIDNEVAQIESQLKAQGTDLDTALAFQGQTRADLTDSLKLKITVEKLISNKINVTEDEIKTYFEQNESTFDKNAKLDDVRETILNTLKQQKLTEEYQKWLSEIKTQANIKYLVNY